MALVLLIEVGQKVDLPGVGTITLTERSGRCARLAFEMDKGQQILLLPAPQRGEANTSPPSRNGR